MYSTSDIAEFLGTDRQNINYYIRKGYLEAIMVEGEYEITQQAYFSFRDEYYDTDKRNTSRGISKKLTDQQINILSNIIQDSRDHTITLTDFKNKYEAERHLIPQLQDFIIYKRDSCIRYDNSQGLKYAKLSLKYGLAEITIKGIVNQNKRSHF